MRIIARSIIVACAIALFAGADRPEQVEFTAPTKLLSPQGTLVAQGWAKSALMQYNREAIPKELLPRVKEWEHYTVMSPEFTVGVTIAQIGSLTFGSVEVIDYKAESRRSAMFLVPFVVDRSLFPADPYGNTDLRRDERFVSLTFAKGKRTIGFNFTKTPSTPAITGKLELDNKKADESIALARPLDEPGQFFYENKIFGMPARGSVMVDDQTYTLPAGNSFAIFDWGRGIWPRHSKWFWGFGAGKVHGHAVAINLGDGYGDDSLGTANAMLVDAKLYKLRDVKYEFNPDDRMQPWKFASDDGRLSLTFRPIYHQEDKQEALVAATELHKIHGRFSGTLVIDGKPVKVDGLLGFAEHMQQRW